MMFLRTDPWSINVQSAIIGFAAAREVRARYVREAPTNSLPNPLQTCGREDLITLVT
jgi:hypothetical protein